MSSEAETFRMRTPSGGQSSISVAPAERGVQISLQRDGERSLAFRLSVEAAQWLADALGRQVLAEAREKEGRK